MSAEPESYSDCPVVELRQYTLHPGQRDVLIDLFDREFIETQESTGIRVLGQFRDLDDENRFVWLRGFADMQARAKALKEFYGGSAWKAHREAANATMIDSDNVFLLRPARKMSGFTLKKSERPPRDATEAARGLVVATIYGLGATGEIEFVEFFESTLKPVLTDSGASIRGYFVTESSENTFPALPVREGEQIFAWFSGFQNQHAYEQFLAAADHRLRAEISDALKPLLQKPPQVLRLSPTNRSLLRA